MRGPARRRAGIGIRVLALALGLVLAAAGCGGGSEKVVIRYSWWGDADRAVLYQEAVDAFMADNPDIDVRTSFGPFDAYFQKLATEAAGGNAPDVMQMDFAYLREYGDRGVLADLKPQVGKNLNIDNLVDGLDGAGEVEDKYYAVPVARNTIGMHYDAALWKESGAPAPKPNWTWKDYERSAQLVTEHTGGRVYGGSDLAWNTGTLISFLMQRGKTEYTEDGQLGFGEQDLIDFWNLGARLRGAGATASPERSIEAKPGSPVAARMAASEHEWDNLIVGNSSTAGVELSLAPLPSDSRELGQYLKPGMLMSVSASTPHQDESTRLIDYMINSPKVAEILGANRGLPATTTQRAAANLQGIDAKVLAYEDRVMKDLQPTPPAPPLGSAAVGRTLDRLNEKVGFGEISPERAAHDFFETAQTSLDSAQESYSGPP